MHFNPYGGAAAELAVRLVNAAPDQDLGRLLAESDYKPLSRIDARQDAELRRWIRELDAVFSNPSVDMLNALLAKTTSRPYISTHDGRAPHLHYSELTAPADERVKAYTAFGLATLFCEDSTRIGRCAREGCPTVFVDTSRNGKRRFCSTKCSTRVHVAQHRQRRPS
ncbi:CGNR zinc finger domain-containing protein [Nocardia uniformis]|uniref:CGNR zinc finger domain-containing protein n=1 Tax=Nocardia uniformis TaxID=53432 RepID=A0A849C0L7_9NOCA|nr:CGNR zinc finger domain-containing protein [Nocardia uniformis]NNH72282.1 CGNR zinc finger domain-containing protein [Nocardia uniformis]